MRLIDAKEAKRKILDEAIMQDWCKVLANCVIDDCPTVDATPVVHAHWEDVDEDENGPVCSHCKGDPESFFLTLPPFPSAIHYMNWKNPPKYCPHCGAVMDEEE